MREREAHHKTMAGVQLEQIVAVQGKMIHHGYARFGIICLSSGSGSLLGSGDYCWQQ